MLHESAPGPYLAAGDRHAPSRSTNRRQPLSAKDPQMSHRLLPRLASVLVAAVLLATAACSGARGGGEGDGISERELVFAYITPETFPYHDGATRFKELIEEKSDGKITVKLYPGGQLGNEREINESILDCAVHIAVGAGALAGPAP